MYVKCDIQKRTVIHILINLKILCVTLLAYATMFIKGHVPYVHPVDQTAMRVLLFNKIRQRSRAPSQNPVKA